MASATPGSSSRIRRKTDDKDPREPNRVLWEHARNGDHEAYSALFDRHADMMWRVAYLLLHGSSAASGAVQETFSRGWESLMSDPGQEGPEGFFYSTAVTVCRWRMKEEEPTAPDGVRDDPLKNELGMILTGILRRQHLRRLAVALGFLSPAQREAYVLHYVEGLPCERVASLLGLSRSAARMLAHHARHVLRQRLGAEVVPNLWRPSEEAGTA